jgi:hypothetical protein
VILHVLLKEKTVTFVNAAVSGSDMRQMAKRADAPKDMKI